jgi:hypothetical protein
MWHLLLVWPVEPDAEAPSRHVGGQPLQLRCSRFPILPLLPSRLEGINCGIAYIQARATLLSRCTTASHVPTAEPAARRAAATAPRRVDALRRTPTPRVQLSGWRWSTRIEPPGERNTRWPAAQAASAARLHRCRLAAGQAASAARLHRCRLVSRASCSRCPLAPCIGFLAPSVPPECPVCRAGSVRIRPTCRRCILAGVLVTPGSSRFGTKWQVHRSRRFQLPPSMFGLWAGC